MPAFLVALGAMIAAWWERAAIVALVSVFISKVGGWLAVNVVNAVVQRAVGLAVIVLWGIFLAAFTTGFDSLHLMSILNGNPLNGMGADAYALFCMVFPFQFFMRLAVAYILWAFTFVAAASVMSRAVRVLFGG